MSTKKVLSLVLAIAMLASIFTCTVAKAELPEGYYVNEDYDATGVHSWTVVTGGTGSPVATVPKISEEGVAEENYAYNLYGEAGSNITAVARTVNGETGIVFEEGKNVIIETKIRMNYDALNGTSGPRLYLGINQGSGIDYSNAGGAIFVANAANNRVFEGGKDFYGTHFELNGGVTSGRWFNVKYIIQGTSGQNILYVTLDDGTEVWNKTVGWPKLNASTIMAPTELKNVIVGTWYGTSNIQVDYLRVYEERPVSAKVASTVTTDGNIEVAFNVDNAAFINAVDLYDEAGLNLIPAQKSYDGSVVIINPDSDLIEGTKYTVKINEAVVKNAGYVFEGASAFSVKASKYLVDEDYSATDAGAWKLVYGTTASITTKALDETNYAAQLNIPDINTAVGYEFNNGKGYDFAEGKNLVVETKFARNHTGSMARFEFKMNVGETIPKLNQAFAWGTTQERNDISYLLWWATEGGVHKAATIDGLQSDLGAYGNNQFVTIKLTFKGNSGLSDMTVTSPDGTVNTYSNVKLPWYGNAVNKNNADSFDSLKTLAFRLQGAGGGANGTSGNTEVYVDYLKVYEEKVVSVAVEPSVSPADDVKVVFGVDDQALVGAVNLYDATGTEIIPAQKSYIAAAKTAVINPDSDLTEGASYVLKVDKAMLKTFGYNYDGAESFTIKASKYIVNEDYSEGNKGGWSNGAAVTDALTGEGNYAVKYAYNTASDIAFSDYSFNGGEGIPYEDGKNLVIETRVLASATGGRMYLGMNRQKVANPNGAGNGSIFIIWPGEGTTSNAQNTYSRVAVEGGSNEVWFNVKLSMIGTTGKGNLLVTLDDGTVVWDVKDKYFPCNNNGNTPTDLEYDKLDSLSVAAWRGDVATYVDYLRVYKAAPVSATVLSTTVLPSENIKVALSADDVRIKDAVKLYNADGTQEIPATYSYEATTKTIIIDPANNLTDGDSYVVKFNKTAISNLGYDFASSDAVSVKVSKYIINEDYAENDKGGWASGTAVTNEFTGEGNYAMSYTATAGGDIAINKYTVNGSDGIAYEEGRNLVIETRILGSSTDNSRIYFGMNHEKTSNPNGAGNGSVFVIWPNDTSTGETGAVSNAYGTFGRTHISGGTNERWFNVQVTMLGTTGKGNLLVTLDDGTVVYDVKGIYLPANRDGNTPTDLEHDFLNSLSVAVWRNSATILVDYLRVYKALPVNVTVADTVMPEEDIFVKFDVDNEGFKNAVKLYNEAETAEIAVSKTYDAATKTVTINPAEDLVNGTRYVVKIDGSALLDLGYKATPEKFIIKASSYLLEDTFDDGSFVGWALNSSAGQIGVEDIGEGNKAFKFTDTTDTDDGQIAIRTFSPIAHKDGFNTVLETRIKHTNPNARSFFKVNINPSFAAESYGNNYMLLQIERNGYQVIYPAGIAPGANNNVSPAKAFDVSCAEMENVWFRVKAYFDNTENVIIEITNEKTGVTQTVTGNLGHYEAANADYSTLRNIALRSRSASDDVYLDYVRIYYEEKTTAAPSYEIAVVTADGTEVTELERGGKYSVHFDIVSGTEDAVGLIALMAVYKDGVLVSESLRSNDINAIKHQNRHESTFEIPEDSEEKYEIKAFLWDSVNGMKPVVTPAYASTPELQ